MEHTKDNPGSCGAGGCLYLSETHWISFLCGLRSSTNHWAELSAAFSLLELAKGRNVEEIQAFVCGNFN